MPTYEVPIQQTLKRERDVRIRNPPAKEGCNTGDHTESPLGERRTAVETSLNLKVGGQ